MKKTLFLTLCLFFIFVASAHGQSLDRAHLGIVNPLEYGDTCTGETLSATISDIGSDIVTLMLPVTDRSKVACEWVISVDLIIPENIALLIPRGATFRIDAGAVLSIKGNIIAGEYPIFDYTLASGARVYLYPTNVDANQLTYGREVILDWFGAIPRDGIDDAHAFMKADDAFRDVAFADGSVGVGLIRIPSVPRFYDIDTDVTLERTTPVGLADRATLQFGCAACTFAIDTPDGIPGLGFEMQMNNLTMRLEGGITRTAGVPLLYIDNGPNPFTLTEMRFQGSVGQYTLELAGGRGSKITNNDFFSNNNTVSINITGGGQYVIDSNTFRGAGTTGDIGVNVATGVHDIFVGPNNNFDDIATPVAWDETTTRVYMTPKQIYHQVTWDAPNIIADGVVTTDVPLSGAFIGGMVDVSAVADMHDKLIITGEVEIQEEVQIKIYNPSAGAIDPPSSVFNIFYRQVPN